jgi:hypothetical protein
LPVKHTPVRLPFVAIIYLGRERTKRRHQVLMALASGMRVTGVPLKDALRLSSQLLDTNGKVENSARATVLSLRR